MNGRTSEGMERGPYLWIKEWMLIVKIVGGNTEDVGKKDVGGGDRYLMGSVTAHLENVQPLCRQHQRAGLNNTQSGMRNHSL